MIRKHWLLRIQVVHAIINDSPYLTIIWPGLPPPEYKIAMIEKMEIPVRMATNSADPDMPSPVKTAVFRRVFADDEWKVAYYEIDRIDS